MSKSGHSNDSGTSLIAIQVIVFLIVNFVLWGIAVGLYNGGSPVGSSRRTGGNIMIFLITSFFAIPEFFSVIGSILKDHKWYAAVFLVVETGLILGLLWMKKVDQDLKSGNPFRRR